MLGEAEGIMQQAIEANPENPRSTCARARCSWRSRCPRQGSRRRRSYRALGTAAMNRARELVKKEDTAYMEVNMAAAHPAHRTRRRAGREDLPRAARPPPDDRSIRIALAQLLAADPAKRQEAIDLLDEDVPTIRRLIGSRVRLRAELQIRTQLVLAGLRIDALAATKDEQRRRSCRPRSTPT